MVAEVEAPAARTANSLPIRTRIAVRTMYLVQGMLPKEIEAAGIGVTAQQVSNLANREGWSRSRREVGKKIEQTVSARVDEAAKAVSEALAVESEELCFKALEVTRAGLAAGGLNGAKQAQAGSATLKNLHSVAQAIRKPAESSQDSAPREMNLFFVGVPMTGSAQAEPKQVTEIEAKSV